MLFILFFPHLIAGPIVRARDFLPQTRRPKRWAWARLNLGVQLFLLGLFKKVAVADRMVLLVDPIFSDPARYRTSALWMAALAWTLQVYCDFSGYSDMALGTAHMLGYKLAQNFDMPFLAPNIAQLWRRWHISLSSWLRDYVFIPLGGSRGTGWRTSRNLVITMTLGGLWHGAAWSYVVFGILQGGLLAGHRQFRLICERWPRLGASLASPLGTTARVALTFTIFTLTLVIFRSATIVGACDMLHGMFIARTGLRLPMAEIALWYAVAVVALAHALGRQRAWSRLITRVPSPVRGLGYALVLSCALLLAPGGHQAFVYFQF
jgi:alginate O-acetyltransferase complex protein AlgI